MLLADFCSWFIKRVLLIGQWFHSPHSRISLYLIKKQGDNLHQLQSIWGTYTPSRLAHDSVLLSVFRPHLFLVIMCLTPSSTLANQKPALWPIVSQSWPFDLVSHGGRGRYASRPMLTLSPAGPPLAYIGLPVQSIYTMTGLVRVWKKRAPP